MLKPTIPYPSRNPINPRITKHAESTLISCSNRVISPSIDQCFSVYKDKMGKLACKVNTP